MTDHDLPAELAWLDHRIVEVPRRREQEGRNGPQRVRGPLSMVHAGRKPVAVLWIRGRANGPVLVAAGGLPGTDGPGDRPYPFPSGARARRLGAGEIDALAAELHWQPCELAFDCEKVDDDGEGDSLEDMFSLNPAAMAVLVAASPVPSSEVESTLSALSDELGQIEGLRAGRGTHRRRLAQVEASLDYYDQKAGAGLWDVAVWTGGANAATADAVAGLLAGGGDIARSPVLLRPSSGAGPSNRTWARTCRIATSDTGLLARPPFRELPGIRVVPIPDFDQNVEDRVQVRLGSVLDAGRAPAAPFGVSLESLNRHTFVTGATGTGKSESVRNLLRALNHRGVPWLVVEPAKSEYAALAPWLEPRNPMVVVRLGDPEVAPPMLNPLEPSALVHDGVLHRFPLQTHLDMVRALFTAAFDTDEPFPQILSAGLTRTYLSNGWNLVTGEPTDPGLSPPAWPSIGDLVRESLAVIDGLGYAREVHDNMQGVVRVRVESLRSGTPGRFFEGGFPLDLNDLLSHPAVFEIEDLGDDQDKAFFIGNLIIRLVELLRLRQKTGIQPPGLSHVLVIEEAHRLLRRVPQESPAAHAVTMFANLLAEIRAYGEGVVVAEQIPSKVIPDLVKNSAVKLMHRLPAEDDRAVVGATMNLNDDQSAHVVSLEPGVAVAHTAGMDRPVLVRIDRAVDRAQTGASMRAPAVSARSAGCPDLCEKAPCTLGEIESSRDLATPAVQLWVEHFVIACLTSDAAGSPSGTWLDRLRAADPRRARCGIGLAVDASVNRRASLIRRWHDPTRMRHDLAERLTGLLRGRPDVDDPLRWAIGQFRVLPLRARLSGEGDRDTPHPDTTRWRRLGLDLPGPSWDEQLEQLEALRRRMPTVSAADLAGRPAVLHELVLAIGHTDGGERRRLDAAVEALGVNHRWISQRVKAQDD